MSQEIPFDNIFDAFAKAAKKFGDNTAIVYLGTRFSYNRIVSLAENFASSLIAEGIEEGDRIVMYIPNSVQ
ncbi:AMP-binding protein, partial [bacterium]|nr:AMP-binding protein [bacterium]